MSWIFFIRRVVFKGMVVFSIFFIFVICVLVRVFFYFGITIRVGLGCWGFGSSSKLYCERLVLGDFLGDGRIREVLVGGGLVRFYMFW